MSNVAHAISDYREDYEIINGQVYMMSSPKYNHVVINGSLHRIFDTYLDGKGCTPFMQFNVFFDEDNQFIPDEIIVCDPEIIEDDAVHGAPDLVVEILSKSTSKIDKNDKFFKYEQYGVKEYWIVDPFIKSVDVYILKDGKFIHDDTYQYYTDEEFEKLNEKYKASAKFEIKVSIYDDFVVQLKDIFKRVK